MKKIFSLAFLFTLIVGSFSSCDVFQQDNDGPCDVDNDARDFYEDDAVRLALRAVPASQFTVPDPLVERMLDALGVVYESDSIERDSIINIYDIHTLANVSDEGVQLTLDTSFTWVQDWIEDGDDDDSDSDSDGDVLSTNPDVANLMGTYGLELEETQLIPINNNSVAILVAEIEPENDDDILNMSAIADAFDAIDGVNSVRVLGISDKDGNDIVASVNGSLVTLTYTVAYEISDTTTTINDCTGTCDFKRNWVFEVDLDNCTAEFLNSSGDAAPEVE